MKWKLVYFDDQILNIECLQEFLRDHFDVVGVTDSTKYSDILKTQNPHVFLIDVHMPLIDGHLLCQKIMEHPSYNGCPIIFISGDQTQENKIRSYKGGGVDFISRDLNPEELVIRLSNKVKFFIHNPKSFQLGNLSLQMNSLMVMINDKAIDLTLIELRILSHILRVYPQTLTREQLIEKIWEDYSVKPGTINTHLTNLKSKIENWNYQIKVRDENVLVTPRDLF